MRLHPVAAGAASPPSEIYFCGLPAVQQFFEQELDDAVLLFGNPHAHTSDEPGRRRL